RPTYRVYRSPLAACAPLPVYVILPATPLRRRPSSPTRRSPDLSLVSRDPALVSRDPSLVARDPSVIGGVPPQAPSWIASRAAGGASTTIRRHRFALNPPLG